VDLSIVIPIYNEREVLELLIQRLGDLLGTLDLQHELIFVDDGCTDGSAEVLRALTVSVPTLTIVRLSRNFGKEAAVTAGLDHSSGDAVIIMDADLQDPPELIPDMLDSWRAGHDVVCMRRRSRRGEARFKCLSAYCFYRLLSAISDVDIPVDTGDFRLLSRKAVNALAQLRERNRYMKGLYAWIGLPTAVIEYDRAPRAAGHTKWNALRLFGLAFEGITSFSTAPLRLAMGIGLVTALVGAVFAIWIIAKTLLFGEPVKGYPSLISIIAVLGGIQLISIGLLGEYIGKTYHETKQRPLYLVRELVNHEK